MSFSKTPRIFYHGFQIVCFSCRNALMRIVSQIYLAPFFVVFLQIWKSGKSPIPSPNIQTFAQQILRFCVGWLQEISCWNALVCGTSMSLLGAEQYFAGCLWIDCCGCHQCTYRFEHRLRTLEMRVDFCIFAVSSSETCVFFVCFCISCIIILIYWWYYWCFFSSEFHEIFLLTLIIVYFEHISNSLISQTFNQSVFFGRKSDAFLEQPRPWGLLYGLG